MLKQDEIALRESIIKEIEVKIQKKKLSKKQHENLINEYVMHLSKITELEGGTHLDISRIIKLTQLRGGR